VTDTASAQLRRILALIPECADDKPHPIAEVAERAGVDPKTLLQDVRALSERFDDPGGFVEAVQIFVEPDRLEVRSDHFLRPMRLTVAELAALELGLSLLASERPPEEQPVLRRARERLEAALAKLPDDVVPDALRHAGAAATADPAALALCRQAYRETRKVRMVYRKASATTDSERTLCPYGIVFASGHWYLVGNGDGATRVRVFRVDRIMKLELLDERFTIPDDFQPSALFTDGRAFASDVAEKVRIRFAPRVARWIAEREGKACEADGSFVQELPLADLDWVVRYTLQYGPEVEVLSPPEARRAVEARLERILESMPIAK
jgi:predicted DNA-binding transcriptional regulator YafY